MAIRQPSPIWPTRFSRGTRASSKKTSPNSLSPVICRSGRTVTPGRVELAEDERDAAVAVLRIGAARGRRSSPPTGRRWSRSSGRSATKWSPSSTALVLSEARSLPAPGSLKPWHQISSPASIGGMKRRRCSSLPWWMSAGPSSPMPSDVEDLRRVGERHLLLEDGLLDLAWRRARPTRRGQSMPR